MQICSPLVNFFVIVISTLPAIVRVTVVEFSASGPITTAAMQCISVLLFLAVITSTLIEAYISDELATALYIVIPLFFKLLASC